MAGLVLGFVAAMFGKLNTELAGLIAAIVGGFFTANGYTTGKGGEPTPDTTGSTTETE